MSNKTLITLAVIFAVLAAMVVVKTSMRREPDITEQVELPSLLPESLEANQLGKLCFFAGGKKDEAVVLSRDADDPDKWYVTGDFNAPAQNEKVEKFVKLVADLRGEFRASAGSQEALEEYNLTEDQAFHVQGYLGDGEEPAFEVLVGKAPDQSQVLMRAAGSNDVFVSNENLRREAGIWQDEPGEVPKPDTWLDKTVVKLDKEQIAKLEMVTPGKRLVLERRDKPSGEDEAENTAEEEAPEAPKPAEYEWVVAEGGPGTGAELKQSGVSSLVNTFAPLTANTVVDPAKKTEYGLDEPGFEMVITLKDREEPVTLLASRKDPAGDGYVMLTQGPREGVIYELTKWQFERAFPKGSNLFELPGLSLSKDDIERVELTQPDGDIVLAKEDAKWTVAEPAAPLPVQESTLNSVASALAAWKAADYADTVEGTGLSNPQRKATFTTADGVTHTIELGNDSRSIDGAYARLDGGDFVGVMNRAELERIFPERKNLYERKVLDIDDFKIRSVTVRRTKDDFIAKKEASGWTLTVDGQKVEPGQDALADYTGDIAALQASDILFGQDSLGAAYGTVRVIMEDNTEYTLTVGKAKDGVHPMTVSGQTLVFGLSAEDLEKLMPASASLRKAEEPAPAAGEGEGAGETAEKDLGPAPPAPAAPEPGPGDAGADAQ